MWCFQAVAMQSKAQSLKAHSRCHWGLHHLNKSKVCVCGNKLDKTFAAPCNNAGLSHCQVCLMQVSICTRRCEFPQYVYEAPKCSHCTPFPRYPLVSPEKGSSDRQTWLHCGTQCLAAEVGVRCDPQAAVSVGSHIMSIIVPSPFILIRGVIYLRSSSSSDVDCCLVGIAISFQLILKKF